MAREVLEIVIDESGAVSGGRRVKRELGEVSDSAKKTDKSMRGLGSSLAGIAKIAAAGIGFAAIAAQMRQAISVSAQFQSALSNLSAITGATGKDLEYLSNQALDISKNSRTASRDVVEAFKLIGSAKPELLKSGEALAEVTRQAVILKEAATIDLASAATALTTSLNQFSAGADQAARFVNVLAAGSQLGSAEVAALTLGITKAGAAAAGAGVGFEELVATFGVLAKSGIPIEQLGTSLRNILIKLQSGADDTNPAIVGLTQALRNLGDQNLTVAETTRKFGLENFNTVEALKKYAAEIDALVPAITDTNVAMEQQAANNNNLESSFDRLSNAVANFYVVIVGKAEDATAVLNGIADAINAISTAFSDVQDAYTKVFDELEKRAPVFADLIDLTFTGTLGHLKNVISLFQDAKHLIKDAPDDGLRGNAPTLPARSGGGGSSGGSSGGAVAGVSETVDAYKDLEKSILADIDALKRLEKANQSGEAAFKRMQTQLEAEQLVRAKGIKLLKDGTDEYTEEAKRILNGLAVRDQLNAAIKDTTQARIDAARAQEEAAEAAKKAQEEAQSERDRLAEENERILQQPFLNAIDGIQGAFKGAFRNILDGGVTSFKDFGDTILNIMKDVVAEIAALMIFKPQLLGGGFGGVAQSLGIPQGGSIFGTGSSVGGNTTARGASGGGAERAAQGGNWYDNYTASGVVTGGVAGLGIGYGIGSSTGLNTTGSTLGGVAGGAIGSAWGPVGTVIGSVAGSIIGGVIGKAFAGKSRDQQFSIATAGRNAQGALDDSGHFLFEGNRTRKSPFGTIGLLNADTSNTKGKLDDAILDTVLAFDEAIAQVLSIRQTEVVARFLRTAKDGATQHASSAGEGDIGRALKDRLGQIAEGLIGRPLGGLADQLAQINDRDVSKIQSEGQRMVELIALFADGFERGLKAITGGLTPLGKQIFDIEEAAKASAKGLLDNIDKVREAVDLLSPKIGDAEGQIIESQRGGASFQEAVQKLVDDGVLKEFPEDMDALRESVRAAKDALKEHNKEQRQAEQSIRKMALAAIGLGEEADKDPLKGAALAIKEMTIRIRAMKPVLKEAGFTGEEAMEKIKKAIEKAKKELRKDFNSSIRDQILQIKDPFKAALNELRETQKQRIQDAKKLGGDLNAVHRLNALERAELEKRFAQQSIDTIKGQIEQLDSFKTSLQTGPLTALSQREQLGVARANFKDVTRKALNGDLDVNEFASAARLFLEEQRAFSGSGGGFQTAFKEVLRVADKLGIDLNKDLARKEENLELRKDIREEAERDRKNRDENTDKLKIVLEDMIEDGKISRTFLKGMSEQLEDLVKVLLEKGQEDAA